MNVRPHPRVSIGMPTLNNATTVGVAVHSILNQTFSDWELLLIDDGSTDGTPRVLKTFVDSRIRVFADGKHLGHAARLNQAVGLSRGEYFARMDGDDVSYPERLAAQVEYISKHLGVDLLGGGVLVFGRDGKACGVRKCPVAHKEICRRPWAGFRLAHPTWLGKIEWFRKHPYRREVPFCQDQDLLLRTFEVSNFAAVPEIVLGYREVLSLKKILMSRRAFASALVRHGFRKRDYKFAGLGPLEQIGKAVVDCVATKTGLNYRILRHRALPADQETLRRWSNVWERAQ